VEKQREFIIDNGDTPSPSPLLKGDQADLVTLELGEATSGEDWL
jgi:hypothetical protein